jgi:DTW domain-containing protein YfiP
VPVVHARTRVVIVRHHLERFRSSNTGRLAALALADSELVEHGLLGAPARLPDLRGAWLLYPTGEPMRAPPEPPPRRLVVLDATWPQARRMYRKLDALRGLPVLHVPVTDVARRRLREAPEPGRVSTIEAIAHALRLLEGDDVAAPLDKLFDVAVARARAAGRRTL